MVSERSQLIIQHAGSTTYDTPLIRFTDTRTDTPHEHVGHPHYCSTEQVNLQMYRKINIAAIT